MPAQQQHCHLLLAVMLRLHTLLRLLQRLKRQMPVLQGVASRWLQHLLPSIAGAAWLQPLLLLVLLHR
jgi:hypothetical protein